MKKAKTGGLGRGLGALGLGKDALTLPTDPPPEEKTETAAASAGVPAELSIDVIQPNRFQPRREFDEAALEELREARLAPVVDFKGKRPRTGDES